MIRPLSKEAVRMTRFAIVLGAAFTFAAGASLAAPAKPAVEEAKDSKEEAKPKAKDGKKQSELDKFKGDFRWGMSPDDVTAKVQDKIRASYEDKLASTANDPTRHARLRKEMTAEVDKVKTKVVKFDGQKSGYDVSIIDQEFLHNSGESMVVMKEDTSDRYFFFKDDRLYKMYIAFDKEILQGKSFREFGQLMQAKFGKAKEVTTSEKTKAGVKVKLDHFVWPNKGGDILRLVDRSEFYDVYCLVIYDAKVDKEQEAARQARRGGPARDNLVEAVTTQPSNDRDPNDNVVDSITGKAVPKPGEQRGEAIVVPSVNSPGSVKAPTPAEVNRKEKAEKAEKGKESKKPESHGLKL
jgi:hypothetical protein